MTGFDLNLDEKETRLILDGLRLLKADRNNKEVQIIERTRGLKPRPLGRVIQPVKGETK